MQLVAYGAQDVYLTGNPQITFFKVVYRRHTNFSMEAIEQTWNGSSTSNGRCTATISRNGDLVHRMYIEFTGAHVSAATSNNSSAQAITDIELEIGGQKIDKQTGHWMETYVELTEPNPTCYMGTTNVAAGTAGGVQGTCFQMMSGMGGANGSNTDTSLAVKHFVPLQFWFCRNPGLALPLIALQYHEVKVILNHTFASIYDGTVSNKLWCDYIYLDTDERRRFAQVSHEYLIEQVQEQSLTLSASGSGSNDLNFNHPVKELIWTGGWASGVSAPVTSTGVTYGIKLNGHDRFAVRDYRYFTLTQVAQHHTGPGGLAKANADTSTSGCHSDSIAVYSFALKPEEHQPSGTCNFSRIDNAQLVSDGDSDAATMFAVNYNVLRIMSGMGGLAYSN
jgi:hypothetical protein